MIDFHFGTPDRELIDRIHRAGVLASWQVGSVQQTLAAARAGCDLIVAQGCEAGGRLAGELELLPLLDRVLDAVALPVVAAGGIGTRADVEAALEAGAAGVRIGTRFVASKESDAHPSWKRALVEARADDSVRTTQFSIGVPELPHRVLRSWLHAAHAHRGEYVGEIDHDSGRIQVRRFASYPPTRDATGAIQAMPFYAGRSVAGVYAVAPAAAIVGPTRSPRATAHPTASTLHPPHPPVRDQVPDRARARCWWRRSPTPAVSASSAPPPSRRRGCCC